MTGDRWNPLDRDAATRRAFLKAWQARGTAELRDRVAELVACAEAATDVELLRRMELAAAGGLDLRDLLTPGPLDNALEAVMAA